MRDSGFLALMLEEHQNDREMEEGSDGSENPYESDDSAEERQRLVLEGAVKKEGWPYVGIDPHYDRVDPCSPIQNLYPAFPLYPAFCGSISGTHIVYNNEGRPLWPNSFYDLSHFGVKLSQNLSFIALPNLYTDLYQKVRLLLVIK